MPRPIKIANAKRTCRIEIRLTDTEAKELIALASEAGLTVSDFLRRGALNVRPRITRATPERAELIRALAELGKIGSNVNQLAKALNTDLAAHVRLTISGETITATLSGLQALSMCLIKHLTNGHPG